MFIFILKDGYESAKVEKLKTKVPKACRELPQLSKLCMDKNSQGSKRCKKLPTITKKCQELSVSWQLLAETFQKVTKPKTIAKKENGRKHMRKGKLTSHINIRSLGEHRCPAVQCCAQACHHIEAVK